MEYTKAARIVTALLLCVSYGCGGDPNKLSESIIKPIIQTNLEKKSQSDESACTKVMWPEGRYGCVESPKSAALIKRGWMTSTREQDRSKSFPPPLPACISKVTDEGRKHLIGVVDGFGPETTQPISLCHAKGFELVSIEEWTPPAQMAGETVSIVKYKYKRANIAPWVTKLEGDADLALFFAVPKDLHDELSGEIWLRLTSNGWRAR